ncbi:DUF2953 domain-containing protein [Bacillaceae bacterium IKA-2]|nr:DUF2953 domain-containing protein [Bacillaceae bacterium IKA-2]
MHWIWWVVIGVISILLLLPFAKISVKIKYYHHQDNDELNVKMSTFFGLASYKVSVPILKIDDDSAAIIVKEEQHSAINDSENTMKITADTIIRSIRDIKNFLKHVIGFSKIIRKFLGRISITKFSWRSCLGVGDAAATGTMVGAAWALKGSAIGMIAHFMKLKVNPILDVQPTFQVPSSHTELSCMISFRLGYAIIAALQIVTHWKRRPKFTTENLFEHNGT